MRTAIRTTVLAAVLLTAVLLPAHAKFYLAGDQDKLELDNIEAIDVELPRAGYSDSTIQLGDYSRGYYTAVLYFSTTCPLGDLQLPAVQRFHDSIRNRGEDNGDNDGIPARIVGVAIDAMGERDVQPFLKEHELEFPVALDPMAQHTRESVDLEELGIPLVLLFSPEGELIGFFQGVERDLPGELWEWINFYNESQRAVPDGEQPARDSAGADAEGEEGGG